LLESVWKHLWTIRLSQNRGSRGFT
jgi:hypothetical protein